MFGRVGNWLSKLFSNEDSEEDDFTEGVEKQYELLKKEEEKETEKLEKEIEDACEKEHKKEPATSDDSYLCQHRVGVLSELCLDYGLIDGKIRFELTCPNAQDLKCGLLVHYVVFRNTTQDEWCLSRVLSFEEAWDEDTIARAVTKNVPTIERTEVGKVGRVKDRNVFVERGSDVPDIEFCLDNINSPFLPMKGDWLCVDVLVEENPKVQDFAGEILCVRSVKPLRLKMFAGCITEWNGNEDEGNINLDVWFSKNACDSDYEPGVGDSVSVQAVECSLNQYQWRAVTVSLVIKKEEQGGQVPVTNHSENGLTPADPNGLKGSKGSDAKMPKRNEKDDENCYISVTKNLHFGTVRRGEKKTLEVEIWNRGSKRQMLIRGRFLGKKCNSQLMVSGLKDSMPICPGDKVICHFECEGKFAGFSRETYAFVFRGFRIIRHLEMEVVDPVVMQLTSADGSLEKKDKYDKYSLAREKLSQKKDVTRIAGISSIKSPPFLPVRFAPYFVPETIWKIVLGLEDSTNNLACTTKSLENLHPSLRNELGITNYCQNFHVLLYLEEIDQTIELQNYDMEDVQFTFAGPGNEYLSLEIPGLIENRPSILLGDRLVAVDPSKPGIEYEGCVHKVCSTIVWLKFAPTFHLQYDGRALRVSFVYGRVQMRRLHAAVDMAVKLLGPDFLFPANLRLQKPQLSIRNRDVSDVVMAEENDHGEDFGSSSTSVSQQQDESKDDNDDGVSKRRAFAIRGLRKPSAPKIPNELVTIRWFNTCLNYHQKMAVINALGGESRPLPYVIFGPPGTGKTITLVETILQIYQLIPDSRIMVATPSNSSANLIAERLLAYSILRPGDLVRLVSHHLLDDDDMLPESLRPYATSVDMTNPKSMQFTCMQRQLQPSSNAWTIGRHRITVGTCMCLGQLVNLGFPCGHFTHVCVDEAGQASEPEIMLPLVFLHKDWGQAILAGDPEQLGPVVFSVIAKYFGLGQSFLARLLNRQMYHRDTVAFPKYGGYNPYLVTRLVMNYRSLPEILNLPSFLFYHSELQPQVPEDGSCEAVLLRSLLTVLPKRDSSLPPALVFHGVRGTDMQEENSPSWFNPQEIGQVIYYLGELLNLGVDVEDIGVITPYRKQVKKLRTLLSVLHLPTPKIGSVEEFQGQERKVIILSSVRSREKFLKKDVQCTLGFVACRQRLNVALTRARALLIIVGNPHLLSKDQYWRDTLLYCLENNAYTGCDLPLTYVARWEEKDEEKDEENLQRQASG